jgi:hypothetical protein
MADVYLYQGEPNPYNVRLRDVTTAPNFNPPSPAGLTSSMVIVSAQRGLRTTGDIRIRTTRPRRDLNGRS